MSKSTGSPVSVTFLGGLNAIGRNCAAIGLGKHLLLIDCGIMFPDTDMLGVDLVLPDFRWLVEDGYTVDACIVTHGHEDHHGALSYLLNELSFPIYGSPLSLSLARNRIEEAGVLDRTELIPVGDNERRKIGAFECEFIPVTHSVPQALAVAIYTPQGLILHTGDFKIDRSPVDGRLTDLDRIAELAVNPGIRLLLSDSTNAEARGWCPSETSVRPGLERAFEAAGDRRVVASCTSSQFHRIRQIIECAREQDRIIATAGFSIRRNVPLAMEMGIVELPADALLDMTDALALPSASVCVLATGSQGEPMSTLTRAATDNAKLLEFTADDVVVLSSRAIPGNEGAVNRLINQLVVRGVNVVHPGTDHVHASGHANSEELVVMLRTAQPEWFIPVHGEPRHLAAHANLARVSGLDADHVVVCENGDRVVFTDSTMEVEKAAVSSEFVFVDGILSDVSHGVLRDRRILSTDGWVAVLVVVDLHSRTLLVGPRVISQGWIDSAKVPDVLEAAETIAGDAVDQLLAGPDPDLDALRQVLRRSVGRYVFKATKRRPMIVPIAIEF